METEGATAEGQPGGEAAWGGCEAATPLSSGELAWDLLQVSPVLLGTRLAVWALALDGIYGPLLSNKQSKLLEGHEDFLRVQPLFRKRSEGANCSATVAETR